MINLVGNIVSFMPFAYFLPLLFKKQRHIIIFIITMVCIIVGVEIMQVVMQSGSGDIDDLILNMLGVLVVYIVFKLPFLHRWLYGMDE
jgi:glycopeptide antibiotics resistance protein